MQGLNLPQGPLSSWVISLAYPTICIDPGFDIFVEDLVCGPPVKKSTNVVLAEAMHEC
jgi:hypothetical protein